MPSAPQHWRLRQNCSPLHSSGGFVKASLRSTTLEASSKLASAPQHCRLCTKLPSAPQHCRLCQNCPTLHNVSGLVNSCALHSELLLVSSKLPCTPQPFWPRKSCPTFRKITGLVKTALRFKSKTLSPASASSSVRGAHALSDQSSWTVSGISSKNRHPLAARSHWLLLPHPHHPAVPCSTDAL